MSMYYEPQIAHERVELEAVGKKLAAGMVPIDLSLFSSATVSSPLSAVCLINKGDPLFTLTVKTTDLQKQELLVISGMEEEQDCLLFTEPALSPSISNLLLEQVHILGQRYDALMANQVSELRAYLDIGLTHLAFNPSDLIVYMNLIGEVLASDGYYILQLNGMYGLDKEAPPDNARMIKAIMSAAVNRFQRPVITQEIVYPDGSDGMILVFRNHAMPPIEQSDLVAAVALALTEDRLVTA